MIQMGLLYAARISNARGKALERQHQGKAAAHVTQKVRADHDATKGDERRNHSGDPKDHAAARRLFLKGRRGKPGEHKANRRVCRVSARKRLKAVLDHAGGDIGPLVGVTDHPPRLKIESLRHRDHAHARARPQRLDDHVEDDGLGDPHGKHHQRPARELFGIGVAREAVDDKVGGDDQHKRQHQLCCDKFAANPQGRNDLVASQTDVDKDAEHGEPFAPPGVGTHRAHEHNARDARRQLERQLAGGLDKAAVHASDVKQRARDLIIEKAAHAQTEAQDNRDSSGIFLVNVPEQ